MHVKRVHEERKSSQCPDCGATFAYLWGLKNHLNTVHEGLKPYRCKICGKDFDRTRYLLRHIAGVHKGETFQIKCHAKERLEKLHKDQIAEEGESDIKPILNAEASAEIKLELE
ncbi:unnamed protein product [Hymenolepis diminuta]|uniref:C2H2-type domain-containing protein n=1 Tax=Hymenolepis diminuta TaxID=6216 RepID=A0A564ZB64_HYMDI|nr:unnamed protein product [Hymenolepis diminuta]